MFEDWADDDQLNHSCDWVHNNARNLVNPLQSNNPDFYKGKNWADTSNTDIDYGGVHTNQTVISHAAYLMSAGLDTDHSVEHLTNLQLAELFHTTSYILPSTCTFEEFSKRLYIIADHMCQNNEITEKQLLCVARAFEKVGLPITDQSIFGRVTDDDGNYIDQATVYFSVNGVQISSVETEKDGSFSAKLPVGTYELQINKDGYQPATQGAKLGINERFVCLDDIVLEKERSNEDKDKLLDGDFSDFAGPYATTSGASTTLYANGMDEWSMGNNSCEVADITKSADGSYTWSILYYDNGNVVDGCRVVLYPVGVNVIAYDGSVLETDTSKMRLWKGNDDVSSVEYIYYKREYYC